MRRQTAYLMAVGMVVASLSGGCSLSSMEKKAKDVTGRSDKTETRVELNNAGRKRLAALPGLTGADTDKIIANRHRAHQALAAESGVIPGHVSTPGCGKTRDPHCDDRRSPQRSASAQAQSE